MPRHLIDLLCLIRPTGVSSYSSIIWANLPWSWAASSGLAATCLGRNPMVQRSVPSRTRTAFITVSIRASGSGSPCTWYTTSITSLLNRTILPGTTWRPQQACWVHERPLSGLWSPTISPSCSWSWCITQFMPPSSRAAVLCREWPGFMPRVTRQREHKGQT